MRGSSGAGTMSDLLCSIIVATLALKKSSGSFGSCGASCAAPTPPGALLVEGGAVLTAPIGDDTATMAAGGCANGATASGGGAPPLLLLVPRRGGGAAPLLLLAPRLGGGAASLLLLVPRLTIAAAGCANGATASGGGGGAASSLLLAPRLTPNALRIVEAPPPSKSLAVALTLISPFVFGMMPPKLRSVGGAKSETLKQHQIEKERRRSLRVRRRAPFEASPYLASKCLQPLPMHLRFLPMSCAGHSTILSRRWIGSRFFFGENLSRSR